MLLAALAQSCQEHAPVNITLNPALRRFVDEQVESGRYADGSDVIRTALRRMEAQERTAALRAEYQSLGGMGNADIMAQAFIVMMEAAKSAQEDLKAIMAQVKAINRAKAALREVMDQVNRDIAGNGCGRDDSHALDYSRGMGSERAYHRVPMPSATSARISSPVGSPELQCSRPSWTSSMASSTA
jgi:putative addiction module CopG family antidote